MELRPDTVVTFVRQALNGMARALDRFDDDSVNVRPHGTTTNSGAALIVHACAAATYWVEHVGLDRPVERDRDSEFDATASVVELRDLLDHTGDRLTALLAGFGAAGPVSDHELRVFLPGGDSSDGALVLHVLEELFQHLGHLELTADAVTCDS